MPHHSSQVACSQQVLVWIWGDHMLSFVLRRITLLKSIPDPFQEGPQKCFCFLYGVLLKIHIRPSSRISIQYTSLRGARKVLFVTTNYVIVCQDTGSLFAQRPWLLGHKRHSGKSSFFVAPFQIGARISYIQRWLTVVSEKNKKT